MPKRQPEYQLQCQVCEYIRWQYSQCLFDSDTIAATRLTAPQATRNKKIQKDGFKRPDIAIYEPNKKYHGLFIELKISSPYLKNGGGLRFDSHLESQAKTLAELNYKGYYACFSWSFDMTKRIIDDYMGNRL